MTRLSQEHDDQALTDPYPVAHLVALLIAWQSFAASTHEFHPTCGRGTVLSVLDGIRVTYVTSLVAAFPDLKQTALQVGLQLAWAPMKALCSESTSDVNTCSDVTSVCAHSKIRCTAEYKRPSFGSYTTLHSSAHRVGTSCCHSVHFNCLPFNRRSIWPAVALARWSHLPLLTTSQPFVPPFMVNPTTP